MPGTSNSLVPVSGQIFGIESRGGSEGLANLYRACILARPDAARGSGVIERLMIGSAISLSC